MDRSTQYRIVILEQREGTWVPAPLDAEYVEMLDEAREHAVYAPIAIYGPGQAPDETPLEQIVDLYSE